MIKRIIRQAVISIIREIIVPIIYTVLNDWEEGKPMHETQKRVKETYKNV